MAASTTQERWLYGPVIDLLLGCGLLYLLAFCVLALYGQQMEGALPHGAIQIGFLLASAAHYGATLLRVYERREDRDAYRLFTVWLTLAIGALCYASLHLPTLGRVLVTVYFAWSPWHYAGQNYGLSMMFLRRRGVEVTPLAKRLLHTSFVLSVVLAVLVLHAPRDVYWLSQVAHPGTLTTLPPVFAPLTLGIPIAVQQVILLTGLAAYGVTLLGAAVLLWRRGSLRDLAPVAALALTHSLWFVLPATLGMLASRPGAAQAVRADQTFGFFFVATGHAVQYLWVTSYYAQRSNQAARLVPYFAKCFLAGNAIWGIPALIFAPGVLGTVAYTEGLAMLIAAGVNLHHFVLDGAIWKLRDSRISRVLIRTERSEAPDASGSQRHWIRPLVWIGGAACFAIAVIAAWEIETGYERAIMRNDAARVELAKQRLLWIGRDDTRPRSFLARHALAQGDTDKALEEIKSSIQLREHPKDIYVAALIREEQGKLEEAGQLYGVARILAPGDLPTLERLAHVHTLLGRNEQAVEVYEWATKLYPDNKELQASLQRSRNRLGSTRQPEGG